VSALMIVSHMHKKVRQRDRHFILQVQRQFIKGGKQLDEICTGTVLSAQVQAANQALKKNLAGLKAEWRTQLGRVGSEARKNYDGVERELEARMAEKDSGYWNLTIKIVLMGGEGED
jgi:hypothetical protein